VNLPTSLNAALLQTANRVPDQLALLDEQTSLTYADVASGVTSLARSLQDGVLQPGDRAVVALPNSVDFVLAHFAVLSAGGVSAPCDPAMPAARLAEIIARSEARVVMTTPEIAERLSEAELRGRPLIIAGDELRARLDSGLGDGLIATSRAEGDAAVILFTTGSTGAPKGVVLTHEATLFTIGNLISVLGYGPEDRELLTLPLSHSFGLGHLYCNLFSGGAVRLEKGMLSLKRVLAGLASLPATGFPSTPAGVGLLIDRAGELFARAGAGLRFMVINSAPLPPERTRQLQALLPHTEIFVYYGLTEASRSTLLSLTRGGPAL
jgi:long-chain acyl-CoA synthetase